MLCKSDIAKRNHLLITQCNSSHCRAQFLNNNSTTNNIKLFHTIQAACILRLQDGKPFIFIYWFSGLRNLQDCRMKFPNKTAINDFYSNSHIVFLPLFITNCQSGKHLTGSQNHLQFYTQHKPVFFSKLPMLHWRPYQAFSSTARNQVPASLLQDFDCKKEDNTVKWTMKL